MSATGATCCRRVFEWQVQARGGTQATAKARTTLLSDGELMRSKTGMNGLSKEQRRLLCMIEQKGKPLSHFRSGRTDAGRWCEQAELHDGTPTGRASASRSLRRLEERGLIELWYFLCGIRKVYVRLTGLVGTITVIAVPLWNLVNH